MTSTGSATVSSIVIVQACSIAVLNTIFLFVIFEMLM